MTDRVPTIHDLKTWPEPFDQVLGGLKSFEVRQDDRGYATGDLLRLCEWDPFGRYYTGRELIRRITCIIRSAGPLALPDGLVVLGLEDTTHAAELARLGALLHQVAELLSVPPVFGAIEEEPLLAAARRVQAMREDSLEMLAACRDEELF